jgi:hypothetical protein
MPQIFKALVSICVWILFIWGCILLINFLVLHIMGGISPVLAMAGWGIAIGSLALATVAARIRQKME